MKPELFWKQIYYEKSKNIVYSRRDRHKIKQREQSPTATKKEVKLIFNSIKDIHNVST